MGVWGYMNKLKLNENAGAQRGGGTEHGNDVHTACIESGMVVKELAAGMRRGSGRWASRMYGRLVVDERK